MDMTASWAVAYADGTRCAQFDATHPDFDPVGGEVPLRTIRWPDVTQVTFTSQWATDTFDYTRPEDGATRLVYRSRRGLAGSAAVFMLCTTTPDAGAVLSDANVRHVWYWFPDGVTHSCAAYNCEQIATRLLALLKGELAPIHLTH